MMESHPSSRHRMGRIEEKQPTESDRRFELIPIPRRLKATPKVISSSCER